MFYKINYSNNEMLWFWLVKKSPEEIAALKESKEKREGLRKQRRVEQEANVRKKEYVSGIDYRLIFWQKDASWTILSAGF